ncbi:MAG: GAF and ANTAR domain-containing protein [Humibacillus sp.]|nr:GAF and ANTAR domain-containing protein [Humibacillus sp.]
MADWGPADLVAATDGVATLMEKLQRDLGEGPCVDASSRRRPVLQPQLAATAPTRWPGFGPPALKAGIAAIFAFPLQVGQIWLGVLDLYRSVAGPLNAHDLTEALAFADAATQVLLHLQDQMPLAEGLHPDLAGHDDHAEIHQATGMVTVQAAVMLTEALLLLRARAFSSGRTLPQVAHDVVDGTLRFNPADEDDEDES